MIKSALYAAIGFAALSSVTTGLSDDREDLSSATAPLPPGTFTTSAHSDEWKIANALSAGPASGRGAYQRSSTANCEAPAKIRALMNTLISGEIPLADAATPNAIPNGITNAAMGAISTLPRHTPRAVKRGRSGRFGRSPDIRCHMKRDPSSGQSTGCACVEWAISPNGQSCR